MHALIKSSFALFQEVSLSMGDSIPVLIQFDPSYKDDFVTRTAESQLEVAFKEHPEKVKISFSLIAKGPWVLSSSGCCGCQQSF